ncbi:MAG: hypothetical protein IKT12_06005, partial [Thermoguttaceae bacterium]|nr:hypothetical protein [Thermoguttaceae bacterium]
MLARLRELCGLENDRYYVNMRERGNTVSSSIPIALIDAVNEGFIRRGESAVLVGFGVGLSWGACRIELDDDLILTVSAHPPDTPQGAAVEADRGAFPFVPAER